MSLGAVEAAREFDSQDLESAAADREVEVEAARPAEAPAWAAWLARRDLRRAVGHREAASAGREA